mmetsp:Transcript_37661/g.91608  ORF Transcript_37661/g.91608 Transcript_37661/m.91608 type:complete len:677 (+) Transcript_37661:57-2087(+)
MSQRATSNGPMCQEQILLSAFNDEDGDEDGSSNALVVDVLLSIRGQFRINKDRSSSSCLLRRDIFDATKHPLIDSVHMSIASHPSRIFPQSPLDDYQRSQQQNQSLQTSLNLSSPPGFSIIIEPMKSTRTAESKAVKNLVHEWIQKRILTTPLVGGTWDIIEETDQEGKGKSRKYQISMPFDGSAWSADALSQSFRATLSSLSSSSSSSSNPYCRIKSIPKRSDNSDGELLQEANSPTKFFGWSSFEWSQLLVGEGAPVSSIESFMKPSNTNTKTKTKTSASISTAELMFYPSYKQMWWTASRSNEGEEDHGDSAVIATEFGIRYQSRLPSTNTSSSSLSSSSSWKSWIPAPFWQQSSTNEVQQQLSSSLSSSTASICSGSGSHDNHRPQITIIPPQQSDSKSEDVSLMDGTTEGLDVRVIPFNQSDVDPVAIHQVIRRHRNNNGRFESSISIDSTRESSECKLMYRQIIPSFMTPSWRSLQISTQYLGANGELTSPLWTPTAPHEGIAGSKVKVNVDWNSEQHNSILYVTIPNNDDGIFLSQATITMEYEPAFLTLDEFPGDPNRGQVVLPGKVTKWCTGNTAPELYYSNALLLIPPVPDLSMPFNVISLTSSLYAYLIGTLVTILVRKGSERIKYKMYPDKKPKPPLTKLKIKLRSKLLFFSRRREDADTAKED